MTQIPEPFSGLVISYSYLWRKDYLAGQEEGVKERPCAIVLCRKLTGDDTVVTVAAITHNEPDNPVSNVTKTLVRSLAKIVSRTA